MEAAHDLFIGTAWLVGGLAFTAISYALASVGNQGSYFLATGAILYGGGRLLYALVLGFRNRRSK